MSKATKKTIRLDQALVTKGLSPSRTKAKELIISGQVEVKTPRGSLIILEPSFEVEDLSAFEAQILSNELLKYVSRSGLKLEAALKQTRIQSLEGHLCMDAGQSTGGFSQVLLEWGADRVIGFDVGHGQLHEVLKNHPKVECFEGINAKVASQVEDLKCFGSQVDFLVGDISFISFSNYISELSSFLKVNAQLLFLIKPQFELDRSRLNKKGIVKKVEDYEKVKAKVCTELEALGFEVIDYFESALRGHDGNQEFFVFAKKF